MTFFLSSTIVVMFALVLIPLALSSLLYLVLVTGRRAKNLPPGPPTLPILGNPHQIPGKGSYLKFTQWAKQYGGLYFLKLGTGTAVVTTNPTDFKLKHISANNCSSRTKCQKNIMALKPDTASIFAAAETHSLSYFADLTSPVFKTSLDRAAKMATYDLPTISVFTEETTTQLSDPSLHGQLIAGPLDHLGGLSEVKGHKS